MPTFNNAHLSGFPLHLQSAAAFQAAVAQEQINSAASNSQWPDGHPMTVASEGPLVRRSWSVALNHARTAQIGSVVVVLAADTNLITETSGVPAVLGNPGDVSVDRVGKYYVMGASVWGPATPISAPPGYYEGNLSTAATYPTSASVVAVSGLSQTALVGGTYKVDASMQYACAPANVSGQCAADLTALIAQVNSLAATGTHVQAYGAGEVITPGVYTTAGAATHTGNIVFDAQGVPGAIFVIRLAAAHALAATASSTMVNGAQSCNIFWLVAGGLTIGATCVLKGTYIGSGAIAPGDVFNLDGRLLTTSGALTMTNATYAVPLGTSVLTVGMLRTFAIFTGLGAISNTVVTGSYGDVTTGGGAVTGMGNINGTFYLATDLESRVSFTIYQNGIPITTTQRNVASRAYSTSQLITLMGLSTVTAGQAISVSAKVDLGSITVGNRALFALKVA